MSKLLIIKKDTKGFTSIFVDNGIILNFNILWVLGDFRNIRKSICNNNNQYKDVYNYSNHPFTKTLEITPDNSQSIYLEVENAFHSMEKISKILHRNESNAFKNYDKIKKELNLEFTNRITSFQNICDKIIKYENVEYEILKNLTVQNYEITYTCFSVSDMIGAIFHFYLLNKFHFVKCLHCGNYYASKTYKQNYCSRLSPYVDIYSAKTSDRKVCKDTVKAARKQLFRRRRRIFAKIEKSINFQLGNETLYKEFSKNSNQYFDRMLKESSIKNLSELNDYLEKIEILEELSK